MKRIITRRLHGPPSLSRTTVSHSPPWSYFGTEINFSVPSLFLIVAGISSGGFHSNSNNHLNSIDASTPTPLRNLWADPYFDIMMPKNVTALVGKSAYLTCRVRNLGNRTVRGA